MVTNFEMTSISYMFMNPINKNFDPLINKHITIYLVNNILYSKI